MPKLAIFIQINKSIIKLTDLLSPLVNLKTMHLKYPSIQMRKHGASWQIQVLQPTSVAGTFKRKIRQGV